MNLHEGLHFISSLTAVQFPSTFSFYPPFIFVHFFFGYCLRVGSVDFFSSYVSFSRTARSSLDGLASSPFFVFCAYFSDSTVD